MEWTSKEFVSVFTYLLPGFLAAWVFHGLTAHPKQTPFERVVQALIFTFIVHLFVPVVHVVFTNPLRPIFVNPYDSGSEDWKKWNVFFDLTASGILAVLIGLVFAFFANHDWLHWVLRKLQITKRTSYPSEWFSAFNRDRRKVILHLDGDK